MTKWFILFYFLHVYSYEKIYVKCKKNNETVIDFFFLKIYGFIKRLLEVSRKTIIL